MNATITPIRHVLATSAKRATARTRAPRRTIHEAGVLDQVRITARNPLAAVMAVLFGGVPVAMTFWLGHFEIDRAAPLGDPLSILVLGGLVFSAPKVVLWAKEAFGRWDLALGFVVLLEGGMTFSRTLWVSVGVCVLLALINMAYTATRLMRGQVVAAEAK